MSQSSLELGIHGFDAPGRGSTTHDRREEGPASVATWAVPHDRERSDSDVALLPAVKEYLVARHRQFPDSISIEECWNLFYRDLSCLIRGSLVERNFPERVLDDCVQDILVEVLIQLSRLGYDPERGSFLSWLLGLVRHKVLDFEHVSARHSDQILVTLVREVADTIPSRDTDPALLYERRRFLRAVASALERLRRRVSATNFQIISLHLTENTRVGELAAAFRLNPQQVRYRLCRMKKRLRALIDLDDPSHLPDRKKNKPG